MYLGTWFESTFYFLPFVVWDAMNILHARQYVEQTVKFYSTIEIEKRCKQREKYRLSRRFFR